MSTKSSKPAAGAAGPDDGAASHHRPSQAPPQQQQSQQRSTKQKQQQQQKQQQKQSRQQSTNHDQQQQSHRQQQQQQQQQQQHHFQQRSTNHQHRPQSHRNDDGSLPKFCHGMCMRPFNSPHDMRRFVSAALVSKDKGEVMMTLGTEQGLKRLSEILCTTFSLSTGENSFVRIALPLCMLLADDSCSSFMVEQRAVLLRVMSTPMFMNDVLGCMKKIGEQLDAALLTNADREAWREIGWHQALHSVCSLFQQLLVKLYDAPASELALSWFQRLNELSGTIMPASNPALARDIANILGRCKSIVARNHPVAESAEIAIPRAVPGPKRAVEEPGPGSHRPDGPRHDNDLEDFRNISILPTDNEIRCQVAPFLPFPEGSRYVADPIDRHLDYHFRLLREEMLSPLRDAVTTFLTPQFMEKCGKTREHRQRIALPNGSFASLLVLKNVKILGCSTHLRQGISVVAEFDQVHQVKDAKFGTIRAFWEGHGARLLQMDSLVCLTIGIQQIVFATVAKRDTASREDLCGATRAKISLRVMSGGQSSILDLLQSGSGSNKRREEITMLQLHGHFFMGFDPVLKSLQRPEAATFPLIPAVLFGFNDDAGVSARELPRYLRNIQQNRAITYDVSCIVRPDAPDQVKLALKNVPMNSFAALRAAMMLHREHITLEGSQLEAFAAALTRSVSLTCGPPGTGKTFVGVQIVLALLHNSAGYRTPAFRDNTQMNRDVNLQLEVETRPHLHPICCICYTNHALDQFLEDIVAKGVPLDQVVRVGGRSRSEALQSRSLGSLVDDRKPSNGRQFWLIKKQAMEIEKQIQENTEKLTSNIGSWPLLEWLKTVGDEAFDVFFTCVRDDKGFEVKGGIVAIFKDWKNGKPLPPLTRRLNLLRSHSQLNLMDKKARLQQIEQWQASILEQTRFELNRDIERYNQLVQQAASINEDDQLEALKKASVIGITTSGCAKYHNLLKGLRPRVVICEEAGEVLESHILASLTSGTEQLVLIGDHLQLRPKIQCYELSAESGQGYDLDLSLFERLVRQLSGSKKDNDGDLCTLDVQHRMRPPIADILRATLYPQLKDAPEVKEYPDLKGFAHNLWFMNHNYKESKDIANSCSNPGEAAMVVQLVRYAVRQGYQPDEIAVLCPYAGQLLLLLKAFKNSMIRLVLDERDFETVDMEELNVEGDDVAVAKAEDDEDSGDDSDGEEEEEALFASALGSHLPALKKKHKKNKKNKGGADVVTTDLNQRVRLRTVDNFQGEEAKLVIVSSVRCNDQRQTGFLKVDNRVNVMLSRAKHGMIIFGSRNTIRAKPNTMFAKVLDYMADRNAVGDHLVLKCQRHGNETRVQSPEEFAKCADDGGCHEPCLQRMECGHACPRLCHPDDINHQQNICKEKCEKLIPKCGHPCQRLCSEVCGGCKMLCSVEHACGHQRTVECQNVDKAKAAPCAVLVSVQLPFCHHTAKLPCHEAQALSAFDETKPKEPSPAALKVLYRCSAPCNQTLSSCYHQCLNKCGECLRVTVNKGGSISGPREHLACKQPCGRTFFCGHECKGVCHPASQCAPCNENCSVSCGHSKCGRKCNIPCPPCVKPCQWVCSSECHSILKCAFPCGSPCVRLPCDRRCTKVLECGHQCPSVCGERCVSKEYCRECGESRRSNDCVDMVMMANLCDHDPNESPLIVLACGHAYTMETLDGQLQLGLFYTRNADGHWDGLVDLSTISDDDLNAVKAVCPNCRAPISNIFRYGRAINTLALKSNLRKNMVAMDVLSNDACKVAVDLRSRLTNGDNKAKSTLQGSIHKVKKELKKDSPAQLLFKNEQKSAVLSGLPSSFVSEPQWQPKCKLLVSLLQLQYSELIFQTSDPVMTLTIAELKKKSTPAAAAATTTTSAAVAAVVEEETNPFQAIHDQFKYCRKTYDKLKEIAAISKSAQKSVEGDFIFIPCVLTYANAVVSIKHKFGSIKSSELPSIQEIFLDAERILEGVTILNDSIRKQRDELAETVSKNKKRALGIGVPLTAEEKKMIFAVMGNEIGTGVGSFGGHWYTCRNGHVYTIGECGGAMQQSRCPECGDAIGGGGHQLQAGNAVAADFLREVGGQQPRPQYAFQ